MNQYFFTISDTLLFCISLEYTKCRTIFSPACNIIYVTFRLWQFQTLLPKLIYPKRMLTLHQVFFSWFINKRIRILRFVERQCRVNQKSLFDWYEQNMFYKTALKLMKFKTITWISFPSALPLLLWDSCLIILAYPYPGALSLHRSKELPSHWCQIRQSPTEEGRPESRKTCEM